MFGIWLDFPEGLGHSTSCRRGSAPHSCSRTARRSERTPTPCLPTPPSSAGKRPPLLQPNSQTIGKAPAPMLATPPLVQRPAAPTHGFATWNRTVLVAEQQQRTLGHVPKKPPMQLDLGRIEVKYAMN